MRKNYTSTKVMPVQTLSDINAAKDYKDEKQIVKLVVVVLRDKPAFIYMTDV